MDRVRERERERESERAKRNTDVVGVVELVLFVTIYTKDCSGFVLFVA